MHIALRKCNHDVRFAKAFINDKAQIAFDHAALDDPLKADPKVHFVQEGTEGRSVNRALICSASIFSLSNRIVFSQHLRGGGIHAHRAGHGFYAVVGFHFALNAVG
jgi:hypothetical protein